MPPSSNNGIPVRWSAAAGTNCGKLWYACRQRGGTDRTWSRVPALTASAPALTMLAPALAQYFLQPGGDRFWTIGVLRALVCAQCICTIRGVATSSFQPSAGCCQSNGSLVIPSAAPPTNAQPASYNGDGIVAYCKNIAVGDQPYQKPIFINNRVFNFVLA